MYVLAIKDTLTSWHDGGAALFCDGLPVCAIANERITRKKYDGHASEAVRYCLNYAGLKLKNIDHVVTIGPKDAGRMMNFLCRLHWRIYGLHIGEHYLWLRHGIEHHQAHMASAFYPSGFDRAVILSVDNMGDIYTTLTAVGEGSRIRTIKGNYFPHSLGMFYSAFTQFCGFEELDAGKLMGLAPYGKESVFYRKIRSLVRLEAGRYGLFWLDGSYLTLEEPGFTPKMIELLGKPRDKDEPITEKHQDIAWACQAVTEEVMLYMVRWLYERTRCDNLCIAGGVGLNSVANSRIVREGPFKNVFIQPASSDTGCALGAALYYQHNVLGLERKYVMRHVYMGRPYNHAEIKAAIPEGDDVIVEQPPNLVERVAKLIADGYIIGWFQGGAELGPRALGHRSILCDSRRADMQDILNARVKHREKFRPFAPAVLLEDASEYFDLSCPSPFMLLVATVHADKRSQIPAVVHVDGTGRVQTVTAEDNGDYYHLIKECKKLTGVGVILNTSFNVAGEPIVETPQDAVRCWQNTGIDHLVLENMLLLKRQPPSILHASGLRK